MKNRLWILALCPLWLSSCNFSLGENTGIPGRRIFVTSQTFDGNLGGLAGADVKCQLAATAAALNGTWRAWLSGNGQNTIEVISLAYPLTRMTGATVFQGANDRQLGIFTNPPAINENGGSTTGNVWTNSDTTGYVVSAATECNGWTSNSGGLNGGFGSNTDTTAGKWTQSGSTACSNSLHLYCIEQ
jgi:hypothetical protein